MTAPPILITSCLLAALYLLKTEATEWEKLPPLPEPNGGFLALVEDTKIIIIGGTHWEGGDKNWLTSHHVLDTQKLVWSSGAKLDAPIAYGIGFPSGYLGGTEGQKFVKELVRYDGAKSSTNYLEELPESLIFSAGGQLSSGTLLIAGGTSNPASLAVLSKSAFAITKAQQVVALPDYPSRPFGIAASATLGEMLYIFAGANWDQANQTTVNTEEAYAFSLETRTWKKLTPFPYPVRGLSAVPLADGTFYLAGGYKSDAEGFTNEAFLYNIQKDEYRPAKPLPYAGMVGLAICDGYLYCLGGEDRQKSRTAACFRIPVTQLGQ